ncbi:MAG: DUF4249 family protein [Bacteroidales bacterium]|nr:DUF4249 family protein [Bacteroidales bacterium]
MLSSDNSSFADIIPIYSNIEGGSGIFGAYTNSRYILIPDKSNYYTLQ